MVVGVINDQRSSDHPDHLLLITWITFFQRSLRSVLIIVQ